METKKIKDTILNLFTVKSIVTFTTLGTLTYLQITQQPVTWVYQALTVVVLASLYGVNLWNKFGRSVFGQDGEEKVRDLDTGVESPTDPEAISNSEIKDQA